MSGSAPGKLRRPSRACLREPCTEFLDPSRAGPAQRPFRGVPGSNCNAAFPAIPAIGSILEQPAGTPAARASRHRQTEALEQGGIDEVPARGHTGRTGLPAESIPEIRPNPAIRAGRAVPAGVREETVDAAHDQPVLRMRPVRKMANAFSRPSRFLCGCSVDTARRKRSGRRRAARSKNTGSTPKRTTRMRDSGMR